MRIYQRETSRVAWADENVSPGTAGDTFYYLDGVLQTLEPPEPNVEVEPKYYENSFTPDTLHEMRRTLEGRVSYFPYSGKLFKYALGEDNGSGSLSIDTGDEEMPTFTLQSQYLQPVEFVRQFAGVYIDRMKWSIEAGGIFASEADLKSFKKPTTPSAEVPSGTRYTLVPAWNSTISLGGVTAKMMSAEIEINNNMEVKHYVEENEGYPSAVIRKKALVTGRVTMNVADSTLWDKLLAYTAVDLIMTIQRDSSNKCVITATNGQLKSAPHNIPEEGIVDVDVDLIFKTMTIVNSGTFI